MIKELGMTKQDIPFTTKVVDVDIHNNCFVTVWIKGDIDIKPGQFIMVWLPGVEEKPFAVTKIEQDKFSITVMKRGKFTKALFNLKVDDIIGWRGPYGNTFSINDKIEQDKEVCIVAGGIGMAALSLLYQKFKKMGTKIKLIYGAKDCNGLIFKDIIGGISTCENTCICTDNGSEGEKAFTTEILEKELEKNKCDKVYTCGPEIMMKKVFEICEKHNVNCEASLERTMGCGFGICGGCTINDKLVCMDGPVFNKKELKQLNDFGNHKCKCKKE
jgi:dihydroorotate dehydrogenase electron transfer subunit